MTLLKRIAVPAVVVALVVAGGVWLLQGSQMKTVTASFPRTVSVYEGSEVRVLGVPVGEVRSVEPSGTEVTVTMAYESDVRVPADANAAIVAPSIVGDRFIQLTPVYSGGEVLEDGATLDQERTATPLELDEIYESIDQLAVALGPQGANRNGALQDLLRSTAQNFAGQGAKFNQTIQDFGNFTETLENNKEELFGASQRLQSFLQTLAESDQTVRDFNSSLARVSEMLSGERQELQAALRNLSVALEDVAGFVRENRGALGRNIRGLNRLSQTLVKRRQALDEILSAGPLALNNLGLTYNPQAGTLDTRANLGEVVHQVQSDPASLLCGIVNQAEQSGDACNLIQQIFPNRPAPGKGGSGTLPPPPESFDRSLAGLVEVEEK